MRAEPGNDYGGNAALAAVLTVLALAGLAWGAGGLWIAKFETDSLHLLDLVLRRAAGAAPHRDFMTPLGVLAYEPFAVLHRAGMGLGHAIAWGQVLVAALAAPLAWWVAASRLPGWLGVGFVLAVLLLVGGMVPGGLDPKITIAMHYNRWAWGLAFVPLAIAALPARRESALADGLAVGLAMAALALLKATYFVAFAPAVIAGLLLRRQGRALGVAVLAGLGVIALASMAYGLGFWAAYVADLRAVAGSEVRAAPAGAALGNVLFAPRFLPATMLALAVLVMLRLKARGEVTVLAVLALMLPGAIYVTYQNYGNDPLWLILPGVVLLALPPGGWRGAPLAGALALAMIAPQALNIALSPLRQVSQPAAAYAALFPGVAGRDDIRGVTARMETIAATVPLEGEGCTLTSGAVGMMRRQAAALEAAGLAGERLLAADIFNFLWLFGDFPPLGGGAPWYYGGLPGGEGATLLVVPDCPADPGVSRAILAGVEAAGLAREAVLATEDMQVFRLRQLP